jgi:NADH:ubiquinone oxidoreductase subunit F (NADH-binding)
LRAVAEGRRGAIVVANGAEGEPASRKDAALLSIAPHLVLDGAMLAADAVHGTDVYVMVDRGNRAGFAAMRRAIGQRANVDARHVHLVDVPSRYVAGEESAVVHLLNGGEAKPVLVPPRPYERGVRGRPTLVQNIETLANLALIGRFGVDWFRSLGTADEPGSVLVTVSGGVASPGVYELALGAPMTSVLDGAGGATEPISAVLLGGYFGSWLPASTLGGLTLTHASLCGAGGALGCGVVVALPASRCGVVETARVANYLAQETAGQCGPCVHGLPAVADQLTAIASGRSVAGAHEAVVRWLGQIEHRGACRMPDAAVGLVRSALRIFADEFALHEEHGVCTARDHRHVLPLPDAATRDWRWR